MPMQFNGNGTSLDQQRQDFTRRRLLATPLAGTIAWTIVGIVGAFASPQMAVLTLFVATGSIVYLGLFLSKFTGENLMAKGRPKNAFDSLFLLTVGMSLLVYPMSLLWFRADYTSLPLTVGTLTGLMWLPISWVVQHYVGLFHAVVRTLLVALVWSLFPQHRFVAVPAVIVAVYLVTIVMLEQRYRSVNREAGA